MFWVTDCADSRLCSTHTQHCAVHTRSTVQYTHTHQGKYAAITPTTSISTDETEPLP